MAQALRGRRAGSGRTRTVLAAGVLALAIAAPGCGSGSPSSSAGQAAKTPNPNAPEINPAGDIPDNQAYVAYAPPGGGFSVNVPEGWSRTSSGGVTSFNDKLNSIRIETTPASAPLTVSGARAELQKLASTVKGYQPRAVSTVSRKAGSAIRIAYLADAQPDPVTGKTHQDAVERYTFFHNGKDVMLTLAGPKGADNVDPWKIVTDSLKWSA